MIKIALILLITLNLISCDTTTKHLDISRSHSNQKTITSHLGSYLTANYSIIKGDAYTASRILNRDLNSLDLLEIKFFSNLVSGNFDVADKVSRKLKVNGKRNILYTTRCVFDLYMKYIITSI